MKAQTRHSKIDAEYHNATAPQYEAVVNEPRRIANDLLFRPLLKEINSPIESILDLGCGTGQMVERLAHWFDPADITAVDHSFGMIDVAKVKVSQLRLTNVHFVVDDLAEFVNTTSRQFDLISCVGVLHHLKRTTCETLVQRCSDLLKPGGWLLIAEPVTRPTLYDFPALVEKWNRRSVLANKAIISELPEPDEAPLPDGFINEQLLTAGFEVIKELAGIEVFPRNLPPSLVDRLFIWAASHIYQKSGFIVAILARPNQLDRHDSGN